MAKTRECPECERELELSEEFWLKNKSSRDGFRNPCKDCVNTKNRNDRAKNPDKYREKEAKWRKDNPDKTKTIKKKEYNKNSEKYKARTKEWRANNLERDAETKHKWYIENKDIVREYNQNYYLQNKEKIIENVTSWIKDNPEKFKAIQAKRRDLKNNLDSNITADQIELLFNIFENKCFKCCSIEDLAIDHHYPLSKGYGLNIFNAVILCKSCNSSKHDKLPEEFYNNEEIENLNMIFIKIKERI